MKRFFFFCAMTLSLLVVSFAGAQSLGDVARQQNKAKRPSAAKVYTNDDIQSTATPRAEPAAAAAENSDKSDTKGAKAEAKPAPEDKAKVAAAFQAKGDGLKKEIAQLEREFTISEREYKLRSAVYYADAGNSLRDPKKWAEQDRQYQAEMAEKRKGIDSAKEKLAQLQEEARKADVSIQ
jgi:hypothetical protein